MPTWLFALVVLGIGLCLALFVDRMLGRSGSVPGEPRQTRARSKWLYYWYLGRFPTKQELDDDERMGRGDGDRRK